MKHITLIGILSREHGGLTRAAFRRSTALAAIGETVEVLCFNVIPDFDEMADHVRRTSEIGTVPLRNFFHDLSLPSHTISKASAVRAGLKTSTSSYHPVDELDVTETEFESPTQSFRFRHYTDTEGVLTRVDFINRENRIFFIDERKANTGRPRRMTLLEPTTGKKLYQGGNYAFQTAWIDTQIGDDHAALGIDGASLATALRGYTRSNVQKNYIIHALHTENDVSPTNGPIRKDRVEAFRSHRTLDNIICLTNRQAQHVAQRLLPACPVRVVPNVIPLAELSDVGRDPNLCVIVSRLSDPAKRLNVWARAFASARDSNPHLRAEIYGGPLSGELYEDLVRTIDELGLREHVVFHGHTDDAADRFAQAGFTVMSSSREGFGMTLVEAMRRGAIPVAFDINYGPAEIIRDRETGFLVTDRDIDGLAAGMVEASKLTDDTMRKAAADAAHKFSPDVIGRRYLEVVNESWQQMHTRRELDTIRAKVAGLTFTSENQRVQFSCTWVDGITPDVDRVEVIATDHHSLITHTTEADQVRFTDFGFDATADIPSEMFENLGGRDVTGWLRLHADGTHQDVRPTWPELWSAWPSRSPTGSFNFR